MSSLGALCTDFYVNQKLALKMDLPSARETVLDLFDRVRKELPQMDQFRRYDGELALESPEADSQYSWLALNQTAIRSGWVNPTNLSEAYRLHRLILASATYRQSSARSELLDTIDPDNRLYGRQTIRRIESEVSK